MTDPIRSKLDPYYRKASKMSKVLFEADPEDVGNFLHRLTLRIVRFFMILAGEAKGDLLWQRAAALTYTTILSLFPLIVLVTAVGSVFYTTEQESELISFIESRLAPPSDVSVPTPIEEERQQEARNITSSIREMSAAYREAAPRVGVLGFIALLVAGFILYVSIESAFDSSWQTLGKRSFVRSLTGFATFVVAAPVIIGVSIMASSFLLSLTQQEAALERATAEAQEMRTQVKNAHGQSSNGQRGGATSSGDQENAEARSTSDWISPSEGQEGAEHSPGLPSGDEPTTGSAPTPDELQAPKESRFNIFRFLLGLVTPLFNSLMLAVAYVMIPQAKVKFRFALVGGLAAGLAWELAKMGFFVYIMFSAQQRALVQSLGAIPIFLVWIYFTWIVFLFGNEISFVCQNFEKLRRQYFGRRRASSIAGQVYLTVMLIVADAFDKKEKGLSNDELLMSLRLPFEEVDEVVETLVKLGYLDLTTDDRFSLGRPGHRISVREILELGCDAKYLCDRKVMEQRPDVGRAILAVEKRLQDAGDDQSLEDLLEQQHKGQTPPAKGND